ncbi:mitoribosomal protein mS72 [Leishmania donovani]|uniref:Uncharacterized protein n=3 Tax=Leishmania donovani species complex TaxID=38574 RepID=A4HZZ3_LEIIN|nr:conserved hypothetical protein [Leishmania infantum JPCM5]XP_003860851.1 hypothetical protein, conserved [Leishmania donovani]CAC9488293.1 hypothetical_protein_-_conserved [Leishmania infantum]AYU78821.1 hypothetical protein LdCL_220017800 [Leishmania donovani]TPP46961.1 hypothetical protein CGC21_2155 [Leishmania donovani]TPP54036.1 hypothetical protein CGC20_16240 [Leishmania donovani]CAJ1988823.1 mitoribosomal protein mS72 [Leishmania donovani]|eukprot:XP_001465634.1 conserved hypothetical protein [Leishmania infantum JPCM5]
MLRQTAAQLNTYLTRSVATPPISVIRTGPKWWAEPERMVKHKVMYFTMGIDQLPLRRTAVIQNDLKRFHMCKPPPRVGDATGYKRSRGAQLTTWYRRIQYQEYHLQHLFVRHMWGLLRMYPGNTTKIQGKADDGYVGYDSVHFHRYNRSPLPFPAREIYERRK